MNQTAGKSGSTPMGAFIFLAAWGWIDISLTIHRAINRASEPKLTQPSPSVAAKTNWSIIPGTTNLCSTNFSITNLRSQFRSNFIILTNFIDTTNYWPVATNTPPRPRIKPIPGTLLVQKGRPS